MSAFLLTPEYIRFQLMLIELGIGDRFDPWLEYLQETQEPLSELALELSFCQSDMNQVIYVLNEYIRGCEIDMTTVIALLRADLWERIASGELDSAGCMHILHRLIQHPEASLGEPWISIDNLWDRYRFSDDVDERPTGAGFEEYFRRFMKEGTTVPGVYDQIYFERISVLERWKEFFQRLFGGRQR